MSDSRDDQLTIIVVTENGRQVAYACRGRAKGCLRNEYRRNKIKCDDCLLTKDSETLEALLDRIKKGDA